MTNKFFLIIYVFIYKTKNQSLELTEGNNCLISQKKKTLHYYGYANHFSF